jgi:uncharacterized membrane-anchored protein YhcB (DUF1043 family)
MTQLTALCLLAALVGIVIGYSLARLEDRAHREP